MNKLSMFEANYSKLLALQQCHISHTLFRPLWGFRELDVSKSAHWATT